MPTWTVTTEHTRQTGEAATTAAAWNAAHNAAAETVRAHVPGLLTLEVDGQRSTIRPTGTGDQLADLHRALDVIESGRAAIVAAHEESQ
jgi:hypothetical protein